MGEHSQFVHNMKVLDINQSSELFMKKAFIDNTDCKCPEELQNIGEEILKWCGGLPLAISVAGGLLQKKTPSKSEWEKVAKEMKSHLERNKDINSISAILELSYHNLPPDLKACFLFLGFFKEDAVIDAKDLIHIWVAQGLVAQEVVGEGETMEDVATDYLNQLISRNMIQVKSSNYDVVEACHMHDLLRDLSQRKAKEEINLEVLMKEEGDSHHSLHKHRHRAMYNTESRFKFLSSTSRNHYLRSLFMTGNYYGDEVPSSYWKSFELLRVLYLGDTRFDVFPKAIGALTGLRYIRMSTLLGGRHVKLPRSWAKLRNLHVLDLGGYSYIVIDKVILKMKNLRHLYARISPRSKVPLSNMKKLQTLTLFPVKESSVWQIQGMAGVTTLGFDMREMSDASKLFTHLATLENLVSLTFKYCRIKDMDGLAALHHITKLKLENFHFQETLTNFPPKLSYLTLRDMELIIDPMLVLERLPELLYLKLVRVHLGGQIREMVITRHGFPKLKVLHFQHMSFINIQVEKGGMPELKQLFIHECNDLNIENLPEHLKSATTHG